MSKIIPIIKGKFLLVLQPTKPSYNYCPSLHVSTLILCLDLALNYELLMHFI